MKISYLVSEPVGSLAELGHIMRGVAGLGYHGIEFVGTHPLGFALDDLLGLSREFDLPVVSLLSGWSYGAEHLCLSSPDAGIRTRAVERLGSYVEYAQKLGSLIVVGLMQGLRSDEPDEAKANDRIAEGLRQVARTAHERGVDIVIEPVNHQQVGFNHSADEVAAMVARVDSPALGYMLDTIHMNIEERSVLGTIRTYGGRARHFHLCETNGGPFGTGGLDFPAVLATLQASGYGHFVSVKVYRKVSGWEEAARSSADFLRRCGVTLRK